MTAFADGVSPPVIIGPLSRSLDRLAGLQERNGLLPLVSDDRVWNLLGQELRDRFDVRPLLVPQGEAAKNWSTLELLLHQLTDLNVTRSTPIVALGGGSVGDVAGLAAALFKRGCPIVQIPTTLLAQADSAIGGKTAIDFAGQKNLVGAFHQPALVLADPSLLSTLDPRQLRAGFAEVVKYGVIGDPAFFGWCEAHGDELLSGHIEHLSDAIGFCAKTKSRIVAADLTDRGGQRALLNFGHSFAHAIEAAAGLGTVLHGEAVAIGMVLALRFSSHIGLSEPGEARRLSALLARAGLPTGLDQVRLNGAALLDHIDRDKKNMSGGITLVLARGIGQAFVQPAVPRERLAAFLAAA
jgi:3-dehydroquinate synthase